jgi:prephenate dehydratase
VTEAHGHVVILPQCAGFLKSHGIKGRVSSDNARAAREVAEAGDKTRAALASELAAEIYGLDVLARHIEDHKNNTTRFLVMSREADHSRGAEDDHHLHLPRPQHSRRRCTRRWAALPPTAST